MRILMTVAELIKELKKYSGNNIVAVGYDGIDIITPSSSPCGRIRGDAKSNETE